MKTILFFVFGFGVLGALGACGDVPETDSTAAAGSGGGAGSSASSSASGGCPAAPECPLCPPGHVSGMLACWELDPLIPTACEGLKRACTEPICPPGFPIPLARSLGVPRLPHCLEGGVVACSLPGQNNTVFVDCCSSVGDVAPSCVTAADCPVPEGICALPWCAPGGVCGICGKGAGSPCGTGTCAGGFCNKIP